ncbi:MAG TPA: mechanosensitive ion channel family protein [Verrucomicrobiae bacterium]|nr:mechanosensitive ion channel family protein [Verrucomicrobiae bacterium]
MGLTELMAVEIYGSSLMQWALAATITTVLVLLVGFAKPILIGRLEKTAPHTRVVIDDAFIYVLRATRLVLVAVVAVDIGSRALQLPPNAQKLLDGAAAIAFFVQVGLWASAMLAFWLDRSQKKAAATNAGMATSLSAIGFVGRILLWAIVVMLALDNLGINITTLIAGLGIGGVAVALAVQNILGDLFASLSIVVDKPFVIGDFIIVDSYAGTVEHVGMKTTRLRSADGEQIIFSNSDLLKGRIKNYKRMYERRIVFTLRLDYETTPEQLAAVPELVRELVESHDKVRFERSHFHRFGESSLELETVFWVTDPDYKLYMDIQQDINLKLMGEFKRRDIQFAMPSRTLKAAQVDKDEDELRVRRGRGDTASRERNR